MKNKVIIITGAAMGLGLAAAKELASRGADLTLVDYNEKSLEEAKKKQKYYLKKPKNFMRHLSRHQRSILIGEKEPLPIFYLSINNCFK